MHKKYQLIGFLFCVLGFESAYGQMTSQQLPDSNPNSAHYHTRYLPALGASQSANESLRDRFGAFAMSEGSGWSGWSVDGETKATAESQAIAQCQDRSSGATDCEVVISFRNKCGL